MRQAAILLCAAVTGIGWSVFRSGAYLPTLDGNVYAMDPTDNSLFMVLSRDANNSLVHIDYSGRLLHYAVTETNQAFENLVVLNDTIYAVLTTYDTGETNQALVSLSMDRSAMRVQTLLELSRLPEAEGAGITWTGVYLPLEDEPSGLRLGGVDQSGRGYLLDWEPETGRTRLKRVLEGEEIYKLKYVDDGRYVWIDTRGQAGQYIGGTWQRDLLGGLAETPYHVSTCGDRVFIADSATGDVFELEKDGSVRLRWRGEEELGRSGCRYRDIMIFTTVRSGDDIEAIALCAAEEGKANVVVGPGGTITALHMGPARVWMVFHRSGTAMLISWALLTAAAELLRAVLRSPRMTVRLAVCELMMAGIMLGAVVGAQYAFYQTTIREDAQQKLRLLGGNLADVLSSEAAMASREVEQAVDEVIRRAANSEQYAVNVVWSGSTPVIGYDSQVPAGYRVMDVKSRGYRSAVEDFLCGDSGHALTQSRNAMNINEYVYIQRVIQGELAGCVTVAQTEQDVLAGRSGFWVSIAPILAACPFLFAALIFVTWYLLRPLGVIREAMEEFYKTGGGNRMDLERMPRTELYQVGQVFNQLSLQTKVQFNTLSTINSAYVRLVPDCLLQMLRRKDVLELSAGEYAAVDGALLMLIPQRPARTAQLLEEMARPAAEQIQSHMGMIIDYDERLGAFTAIFSSAEQAGDCARRCVSDRSGERKVMAAVFTESVEMGVFGSEKLLYPMAVSAALHRRQEVLSLLSRFDAVLVQGGGAGTHLRLLGWDGEMAYWEDPACRSGSWQAQWKAAAPLWEEAMVLFREERFAEAMRRFARILRVMPGDQAARWYLFRCETLRDHPGEHPDVGLLFDWEERHG